MAAPKGNRNSSAENRMWADALRRALAQIELRDEDGKRRKGIALRRIAERTVMQAIEGDKDARREIADRLDGKPAQTITGGEGGPVLIQEVPWLRGRSL